mgnify:CR=1 FL=1
MTFATITTPPQRLLAEAKWAFATRRVSRIDGAALRDDFAAAAPGDLILARVSEIGQHKGIQLVSGRRAALFPGDLVVMPVAARYATDQFEGTAEIDARGADMLAGGGCLGRMRARHERMRPATRVIPLGRIMTAAGAPMNLADYALPDAPAPAGLPVIAVLGTSMNSGKTLATARLGLGLRRAGRKVALVKGTGTAAFGDFNEYADTGAAYVGDFTDGGLATTYLAPVGRIRAATDRVLAEAGRRGCDVAVMEIADGLLQRETAALLADPEFSAGLAGIVFACGDPLAATGGAAELARNGLRPLALTGMVSCSPMASAEAEDATGLRVMTKEALADPAQAMRLLREATGAMRGAVA